MNCIIHNIIIHYFKLHTNLTVVIYSSCDLWRKGNAYSHCCRTIMSLKGLIMDLAEKDLLLCN